MILREKSGLWKKISFSRVNEKLDSDLSKAVLYLDFIMKTDASLNPITYL